MKLDTKLVLNRDLIQAPNLTDRFGVLDLSTIGGLTVRGFEIDDGSRTSWKQRNEAGMDLALQIQKDKNFPWQGCSNVVFPLVTVAALQFSARAYNNILQGADVVKYRVLGEDESGKVTERAVRISQHMSWQVLEQDQSWEEQHDRLFINLAIVGTSFVKTYFSPALGHNVSELVLAQDFILNYYAKSVESCPRKTQILRLSKNDIYERCRRGIYDEKVLDEGWFNTNAPPPTTQTFRSDVRHGVTAPPPDEDTPHEVLEQHRLLDLDQDGYAEPYIVTVEKNSKRVLRIVSRVDDMDKQVERNSSGKILVINPSEYYTKYSFVPSPDGGIYDIGFGTLLGPLNESVNTGINQLLDSGTMQNSMGGFLGRGAKIRGGVYSMSPWEWKRIDSTGDDLRKSMVPFPERQPSVVMFQLLNLLIGYTDRVSGANDTMVGVSPGQNTPAETTRTVVEQGMQIYSVIFKRIWRSMKEEFKKLHVLNGMYLKSKDTFGANKQEIRREDYNSDPDQVVPSADPHITSVGQRVQQATMLKQAAMATPGYDPEVVERRFLRALQVDGIAEVYPGLKKFPPPPDSKVLVEQGKQKLKAIDQQLKHQSFMLQLAETARINNAKIAQLEAQALSLMQQAGLKRGDQQLAAFDMAINAMQNHNKMILEHMRKSAEGETGSGTETSGGAGVPRLAGPPSDAGIPSDAEDVGGGDQGSMG